MRVGLIALSLAALCACASFVEPANAQSRRGQAAAPTAPLLTPEQQLMEAERRLAVAAQSQGYGTALGAALDTTDGFVVRPGGVLKSADVPTLASPQPMAGPVFWQPDRVFVSASGDMGVTSGRYVQVLTGVEAAQGRYVTVWRKQANGDWLVLSETRTPDPTASPTPRPTPAVRRRR